MSAKSNAVSLVVDELDRATALFGPFTSAHEGYAVILEEVRELEKEVFMNPRKRSVARMQDEAVQLAAMALRFLTDVCSPVAAS